MAVRPPVGPTVGVEEEFFLVAATADRLTERNDRVAVGARRRGAEVHRELKRSQVELSTPVCRSASEVRAHLVAGRRALAAAARDEDAALLPSGVPPIPHAVPDVTDLPRYRTMTARYGEFVRENNICGCHVHVGIEDRDTALQVSNHLRPWLPTLLALTANSPIHQGRDTGFASWRAMMACRWPCSGPPPWFESVEHYDTVVATMIECGSILDVGMVYWDVRLSAHLPTVEVRVSDVPATVDETVLLATLVRALVATAVQDVEAGRPAPPVGSEMLRAAYLCAAQDGPAGRAVDPLTCRVVDGQERIRALLRHVAPRLEAFGEYTCAERLLVRVLRRGNGAVFQRRAFGQRDDPSDIVRDLARRAVPEI